MTISDFAFGLHLVYHIFLRRILLSALAGP